MQLSQTRVVYLAEATQQDLPGGAQENTFLMILSTSSLSAEKYMHCTHLTI